ncbi:MAG: hypothetical protein L3J98_08645 [Gammaproteobacteria bacterium]|nr:hypothetical protein [Gammaproteobacteria bacterium]
MLPVKWIIQSVVIFFSLLLGACGGGGGSGGGDTLNSAPTVAISSPTNGGTYPEGSDISFIGAGSDEEDGTLTGTSFDWSSHADGQLGTGTDVSSILSVGSHTITLEATDSGGATDTDTITITVNAAPVINNVTVTPASVGADMPVTVSWDIADAEGDTLICNLDVDADGSDDYTIDDCVNNTSKIHTYTQAGDYQIRLTIVDGINAQVQQSVSVTVIDLGDAPEIAHFSATPETAETSKPITFSWDVSDANGDTLTCKLDIDTDGTDDYTIDDCANNSSQAHIYTQADVYQIQLTVDDGINSPVQSSINLTVSSASPAISQFTVDPDPAYSTVATTFYWQVSDPEGDTLTCTLDVNNDGSDDYTIDDCVNIASQEHIYASNGDFTAQLTVQDSVNEVQTSLSLAVKSPLLLDVSVNGPVSSDGRGLYTMTVSNVSAQSIDDVSVMYTVPAELQFDAENDAEPNAEGCETTCTDGVEASWALGALAGGESRTITINAQVLSGVNTDVQIVVPVRVTSSSITDIVSVSRAVVVDNNPKSQLAMSVSVDPLMPGDSLTFTVGVGNIDNAMLNNLELRAILPAGISVDNISDSGTEDAVTGDVVWGLSSLAEGKTFWRTIDATVSATAIAGQILVTHAELRHDGNVTFDASAEQVVTVVEEAFPIMLAINTAAESVEAGKRLRYELIISNVSTVPVNDVSVLLRVPFELQFDAENDAEPDATGCGAACIGGQEAFWILGTLDGGASRTITVDALAAAGLLNGGLITVPVRVTAAGLGGDIDRVKTVAVAIDPVIGDLALAERSGCLLCHGIETAILAPTWKDVANRYRGDADAKAMLIEKVKNGGSGNWGSASMPPYSPQVSDINIEALVDFILNL